MYLRIEGGAEYDASPRLVEYIVALTKALARAVNAAVPGAALRWEGGEREPV